MLVRKEDSPADPAYPDAKEFLKNRAAISAAIIGAGMALGGCAGKGRTGGLPGGSGGVVAVPDGSNEKRAADPKTGQGLDRTSIDGVPAFEPKSDPPRLPGKARIEPPPLPGSPPVVPPNPEH